MILGKSAESAMKAFTALESGHRDAVVLENGAVRVVVDLLGGMIPEFSLLRDGSSINAHWIPWFRSMFPAAPDGKAPFDVGFWGVPLLANLAGNFPCLPAFGGGAPVDGAEIPPHGWTANSLWKLEGLGTSADGLKAWGRFGLRIRAGGFDLDFDKTDLLVAGESVHYSVLGIRNLGSEEVPVNAAWHNTVGAPFLEAGCRISASADSWISAPAGGEFEATSRLALGAEFSSLAEAPLKAGGSVDLTRVPGMIGFTDFATGAVPADARLGWSACVNEAASIAYVTWFPGPASVREGEIGLNFNDLWMQYGGRRFPPWALYDGGADQSFCLGMENSTAAWANGLAESRARKQLLGRPTTVTIKAGERMILPYATGLFDLRSARPEGPILGIEADEEGLALAFSGSSIKVKADGSLDRLRRDVSGDGIR